MSDQLQTIVADSGLEPTKAKVMLAQFQDYFEIAADWETKAKAIVVTDDSQKAEMQMARAGRLFLKEKRVAIEKTRKELKEQALREGKAIDGIANVLKALIVPLEKHLEAQEKFVEIRGKAEAERLRIEAEKKAEAERIAKEEAEKAEQERIRLENERLRKEAEEREKVIAEERAKAERERIEAEKKLADERAAAGDKIKAAENRAARVERERGGEVECPNCHHKFVPGQQKEEAA